MTSPADIPGLPEVPTPVTLDRLVTLLGAEHYVVDRERSTLRRQFDGADLVISLSQGASGVLIMRGTRRGPAIAPERRPDVEAFANDWHRERVWPIVVLADGESLTVHTHFGADTTAGLTQEQLRENLRVGIATMRQCFDSLATAPWLGGAAGSADPEAG